MEHSPHNKIRNNIKYVFFLSITIILREIDSIFINKNCPPKLLTTFLMFGGEAFFGIAYFVCKIKTLIEEKEPKFMGIPLIFGVVNKKDSAIKIIIYIIIASGLDFTSFVLINYILPRHTSENFSDSFLEIRLKPMQIIFSSIICYFLFKRAVYLHQMLSLLLIILSLVGIIFAENFLTEKNDKTEIFKIIFIIIISFLIISIADCLEKYLMDLNFCSQFKLLFIEGIPGIIFTSFFYIFIRNSDVSGENCNGNKLVLIVLSILYFLLSGLLNAYRLTVIMKLSPMNRTTSDSFVDPFIIIYSIIFANNSSKNNNTYYKLSYRIANFSATLIIIFCCLIYNEIVILKCCKLDENTYSEIADRSNADNSVEFEYQKTFSSNSVNSVDTESND